MSDVFDEYCRISMEKGIVKEASEKALTREEKERNSEYKEKIMSLYGIDIDKEDIVEKAHPDPVVVAPSYDKLNALVENINERHNVMVGITNKMPNGNLTGHKYAKRELLDELIRLGFKLDNAGEDRLCKMADTCSVKLTNELKKEALKKEAIPAFLALLAKPLVIKGLAWGVGLVSTYSAYKNLFGENIREGIIPDTNKAIEELTDVYNKVGGADKRKVSWWLENLKYLLSITPKAMAIVERPSSTKPIRSHEDAMKVQEETDLAEAEIKELTKYNEYFQKLSAALEGFANEVSNMVGTGSEESSSEAWKTITNIWESVVGSDFSEARRALVTLKTSIDKQISDFNDLLKSGDKVKEKEEEVTRELIALKDSVQSGSLQDKAQSTVKDLAEAFKADYTFDG